MGVYFSALLLARMPQGCIAVAVLFVTITPNTATTISYPKFANCFLKHYWEKNNKKKKQKSDTVHAKQMKVGDSKTIPGGKREDEGYPTRQDSLAAGSALLQVDIPAGCRSEEMPRPVTSCPIRDFSGTQQLQVRLKIKSVASYG